MVEKGGGGYIYVYIVLKELNNIGMEQDDEKRTSSREMEEYIDGCTIF